MTAIILDIVVPRRANSIPRVAGLQISLRPHMRHRGSYLAVAVKRDGVTFTQLMERISGNYDLGQIEQFRRSIGAGAEIVRR